MGKEVKKTQLKDAVGDAIQEDPSVVVDALADMDDDQIPDEAPTWMHGDRIVDAATKAAIKATGLPRDAEDDAMESADRAGWRLRNGKSMFEQLRGKGGASPSRVSPVTKGAAGQRVMQRETEGTTDAPIGSGRLASKYLYYSALASKQGKNVKSLEDVKETAKNAAGDDQMVKVIDKNQESSDFSQGGALLPDEVSEDIISFLHGKTTFRQLEPEIIPLESGSLAFPRVDATVGASFVGEAGTTNAQSLDTGRVNLDERYLQIIVIITEQMLRHGEPQVGVLSILEQEMQRSAATTEETALLRGTGTNSEPEGLRELVASGNRDLDRQQSGSASDAEEIMGDLMRLQERVYASDSNVMRERPAYVMTERTALGLQALSDAENRPHPIAEMVASGELYGANIGRTNQIPTDLDVDATDDSDHTELYFCEMSEALLGQGINAEIEESSEATVFDGAGNRYSLFLRNSRGLRLQHGVDLALRHDTSAANLKNVDWGADIL